MILAGNCALESMGSRPSASAAGEKTSGSLGGYLLGQRGHLLGDKRYSGDRELENPLAACRWSHLRKSGRAKRQSGPGCLGRDVRETFARMAMNDEETVALVAGGHTFARLTAQGIILCWP